MTTKKLFIILTLCLQVVLLWAQTPKSITVSQGESFTDHLALENDSKDMDLMVKFVFNEEKNTLTVSLISYRTLFVFWDNTYYKEAIRRRWIRPDRLPYVVSTNKDDRFRITKDFHRTLHKPRKKHVFRKWVETDGLQPVVTELKMVNDFIEQTFDIQGRRSNVTVRLRDLMLMDEKKHKGNSRYFEITYGKDLNIEYRVTIQRNPCFGMDEEITAANNALEAIRKSYAAFSKRYAGDKVSNDDAMAAFRELKGTLTAQFPKNNEISTCPDIQQARNNYNLLVDSIQQINVTVEATPDDALVAIGGAEGQALNAKRILSNVRLLDNLISRWLVSHDETERDDLIEQCHNIIKETSIMVRSCQKQTSEERKAINLFREAEQYFNRTCR